MPQAVKSSLLLYADDSCILYQDKEVDEIKKQFNSGNTCDWYADNKLSIYFGKDKTKLITFGSKPRVKDVCELNIRYKCINIKQYF